MAVFGVTGGGTLSCAVAGGRRGYELRADLDFDTNGGGGPDAGGRLGGRQRMKSVTSSSSTSSKTAIVKIRSMRSAVTRSTFSLKRSIRCSIQKRLATSVAMIAANARANGMRRRFPICRPS
ncbi:MAG: hypothetical protein OXF93_01545 [Acidobacteria bacterium]|nr:hypothetical protein [Acidobacteriota bacterium]